MAYEKWTPSTTFELPGSGGLKDANLDTGLVNNSLNSLELGRYIFELRGGTAPAGQMISGIVSAVVGGTPIENAPISVCVLAGQPCSTTSTNSLGIYRIAGVPDGDYTVSVFPPTPSSLLPEEVTPVSVSGSDITVNVALEGPTPPPAGTTIEPSRNGGFSTGDSLARHC